MIFALATKSTFTFCTLNQEEALVGDFSVVMKTLPMVRLQL